LRQESHRSLLGSSKSLTRDIAAVMIDLDGTLLDTVADIAAAAERMLAALGLRMCTQEEIRSFIGKGIPNLVQRCLQSSAGAARAQDLQTDALARYHDYYFEESGRRSTVYPGVNEGLAQMRAMRLRLACVTNKVARYTLPLLEQKGLAHYFELVVSGDTLARKKPDKMQLAHICAAFALPPERVLLIGDSANDVAAARAAGCPIWCVPYGYSECGDVQDLHCDAIVGTLSEAANILQSTRS
jgi:phosphoglycolate phosphatase